MALSAAFALGWESIVSQAARPLTNASDFAFTNNDTNASKIRLSSLKMHLTLSKERATVAPKVTVFSQRTNISFVSGNFTSPHSQMIVGDDQILRMHLLRHKP